MSKDRPLGITILAIVFGLSTLMLLWAFTRMPNSNFGAVLVDLNQFGISTGRLIAEIILQVGLIIGCCVGLWTGKKWGWWIATVFWMYTLTKDVNGIRQLPMLTRHSLIAPNELFGYFVRQNLLALRDILILFYLFRRNVLSYFELSQISNWKLILQVISMVLLMIIVINFL